jgi:hypothetical protein
VLRTVALAAALSAILAATAPAQQIAADLELALAVDASASVDDGEFRLQLGGIAAGFRDVEVQAAIASGPAGRIAVNLVVWAEAQYPKDFSGWHVLETAADAEGFAALVEAFPRRLTGGTGLGEGIARAIGSFDRNAVTAPRQVVDVSGDGEETTPREYVVVVEQARAMAHARGVTVNGLAILNEVPDLDRYYRLKIQIGPRSFVMAAADYETFAEAMRRKLLREIEYLPELSAR